MPIDPNFSLTCPRMILRPLTVQDLTAMHETIMGDAEVMRYIGSGSISTREQTAKFLNWIIAQYPHSELGWFAMVPNRSVDTIEAMPDLMGIACLKPVRGDLLNVFGEHVEVGYWLVKGCWGRGYATEAATRLLRYGFEDLNLNEVIGMADLRNEASSRVLLRSGMTHRQTKAVWNIPVACYGILREDYLKMPAHGE